jgi:hypothetical protein
MKGKAITRILDVITKDLHCEFKAKTKNNLRIGELLVEAQAQLDHGKWLAWLEENFALTDRTARRRMAVYRFVESMGISDTVSDLHIHTSAWYELSTDDKFSPKEIKAVLKVAESRWVDVDRLYEIVSATREAKAIRDRANAEGKTVAEVKAEMKAEVEAAAKAREQARIDLQKEQRRQESEKHKKEMQDRAEAEALLDGPAPELPAAEEAAPLPREASLHSTLVQGVNLLMGIRTTPAEKLAGAEVRREDLQFLANFLIQVAKAKEQRLNVLTEQLIIDGPAGAANTEAGPDY